jgi:hypothetical protein
LRTGLSDLGKLVRKLTGALELRPGVLGYRAAELWPEIAGPRVAAHTWITSIRGDTLFVATDSPVWAAELQVLEPQLLERLVARLGSECPLRHLRFRTSGRPPGQAPPRPAGSKAERPRPGRRPEVSAEAAAAARLAATEVRDADVARALEKVLRAQDGGRSRSGGGRSRADGDAGHVPGGSGSML